MRAIPTVLLISLLAAACATRPNRVESKWPVTVPLRKTATIAMLEPVVTAEDDSAARCGDRERRRAQNLSGVVERELYDAGFEIEKPGEPQRDRPLSARVSVALADCDDGLLGDIALTLTASSSTVATIRAERFLMTNLRVAANRLVDGVVSSEPVARYLESPAFER